jgi:hypothetical protein
MANFSYQHLFLNDEVLATDSGGYLESMIPGENGAVSVRRDKPA